MSKFGDYMSEAVREIFKGLSMEIPATVVLSEEELDEVALLETMLEDNAIEYQISLQFDMRKTTNIGIHYVCLREDTSISKLVENPSISNEVILLLFQKLLLRTYSYSDSMKLTLLNHPLLRGNLELFKLIFYRFREDAPDLMPISTSIYEPTHVDVFMLLVGEMFNYPNERLKSFYGIEMWRRQKEVYAWLEENNPSLMNLPIKWVVKAYGMPLPATLN